MKEGAVLVSLDARTDSAQLKALEAAARLAEQEYERFQTLFKQGSISRSELDRRQSERDQAIATANAQRERVAQKPFAHRSAANSAFVRSTLVSI